MAIGFTYDQIQKNVNDPLDAADKVEAASFAEVRAKLEGTSAWTDMPTPEAYRTILRAFINTADPIQRDTAAAFRAHAQIMANHARNTGVVLDEETRARLDALTAEVQGSEPQTPPPPTGTPGGNIDTYS